MVVAPDTLPRAFITSEYPLMLKEVPSKVRFALPDAMFEEFL